ncbi:MAG TPA: pyrimidine-nucleoside phosphorylase [Clostridiales bacterium]|nr:pyrimidine-nucleoside phosphorylase [Clostridiales bacterium]
MRMYDLIKKKKEGKELTKEEINLMIKAYVNSEIPDYQMSAMLMAICFQGMNDVETAELTMSMAKSGDMVDLSSIEGVKVDKHSTGGVGDKTTLVIAPIVAACGVKVAKMSGRGLGHTGGTIDKLEAIPGIRLAIEEEEFFSIVNKVGVSVVGQSGNLAPADKMLYALRDVTATVDSIPLISASIMSKKLAAGSDCILLDVKTGSGAFMQTIDESIELAKRMVAIGEHSNRRTMALITDMDIPLGYGIGNSIEVIEAINTLRGKGPKDLTEVCVILASNMLHLAGKGDLEDCEAMVLETIKDGSALNKLAQMVEAQGGDANFILDTNKFDKSKYSKNIISDKAGYISHMNTEECGIGSMLLGAGRETQESILDYSAGIILNKKTGDYVEKGDVLAVLYGSDEDLFEKAEQVIKEAYIFSDNAIKNRPLVLAKVSKDNIEKY